MRKITATSVCITTRCSRQCPDCCCKHDEIWDADVTYVENLIEVIGWPVRFHVTGGEPTECPSFHQISHYMYVMSPSRLWTIETARFHRALAFYDEVYFSHYGDNDDDCRKVVALGEEKGFKVHVGKIWHLPDIPGGGRVCHRGISELIAVYKDRVFPCCVGPGISGAESIPVSTDVRKKVLDVPMPCDRCRFSV